ncbi:MAG: nitroreductase family protein [Methylovirgula sp.]
MAHPVPTKARAEDQPAPTIPLPQPHMSGGQSLLDALHNRKSTREFASQRLSLDLLSDLLWAANGYNRPETKHRTAPTAHDRQEIDIYAALETGLYLYDAEANLLHMINGQDLRSATGEQDYVATAPLDLIYVADLARMEDAADRAEKKFYSAIDAGFIAQNVYLFCASQGLATVVRGLVPRARLAEMMGLRPSQRIIAAQSVGFPR